MTKECSPTKIPSFLTKLGFKQINNISDAVNYNNENGGEFILIKENDSIYRYDLNSGKPIDNNNILGTKDNVLPEGQNSRWIKCNKTDESNKFTNNITNCITYIPQSILLELTNNTLTLKAGSTFYIPDGINIFNKIITTQDKSLSNVGNYGKIFVDEQGNIKTGIYGEDSDPLSFYYDPKLNTVRYFNKYGEEEAKKYSLPLGEIKNNLLITFNSYGYIGSTLFVLPGVKGLCPNGINKKDGSLKNITQEYSSIKLKTFSSADTVYFGNGGDYIYSRRKDTVYYDEYNNVNIRVEDNIQLGFSIEGELITDSKGKIISFKPKQIFRAVDYNEFKRSFSVPTGTILPITSSIAPDGFIRCDGAQVSRQTYKNLFDIITTSYGAGNGSTTFNLPNLNEKTLWGNGTGYKNAGLPNITGEFLPMRFAGNTTANGAFYNSNTTTTGKNSDSHNHNNVGTGFSAARSNSIYGASSTVQPPACVVYFYIKY